METKEIMSRLQRKYQYVKFYASPEETPYTARCGKVDTVFELRPSTSSALFDEVEAEGRKRLRMIA